MSGPILKERKSDGSLYHDKCLEGLETLKKDSKKTVSYMVKEFEMKKAADQYARAAVSKTGSLDMSRLHTYKYNEDLFKKVTTLPGATNHGMIMCLDWSGSMCNNLKGTLSQLFNLIWFCRQTRIPFEVFAFSDSYGREKYRSWDDKNDDVTYEAYVSQQNLLMDDSDEPIKHPLINEIFSGKRGSTYFKPSN